ncbi:MAG: alpha/beta fold hydrolase [Syntrophobacteraceae bacterium]|nr:alpha/beta fold hydrolase [Syntrophobacteraceae bacterium]
MPEQRARIAAGPHELEGAYGAGSGREGVVVCHPHPLYGGSMDNNVVLALQRSLASVGWATLRFNFRGVGSSGGTYGDGHGEVEDLLAAAAFLGHQGLERIHVAGYSFGAWVALGACQEQRMKPAALILVSPPLDFLDFTSLYLPTSPTLITLGESDSFCGVPALRQWTAGPAMRQSKEPRVEILTDCDHFYRGHEAKLERIVEAFAKAITEGFREHAAGKTGPPNR